MNALPPKSCKVYTSFALADKLVKALGDSSGAKWLEPAHGHGVFLTALSDYRVKPSRIVAIDLDRRPLQCDRLAKTERGVDFLDWASQTSWRFDRVVGNPPFVRISRLPRALQKTAENVLDVNGKPIGRRANLWYAFLLSAIRLLKPGGSLGFILPSSAEFADYALPLRETIHRSFGEIQVFRCLTPLFDDVHEGTVAVVARDFGSRLRRFRRFSLRSRLSFLGALSRMDAVTGRPCARLASIARERTVLLKSIASIRLGGVTGDVRYFLLSEHRRRYLRIPRAAVRPVVSKAKHLCSPSINKAKWEALLRSGQRVWLFCPSGSVVKHRSVRRYLRMDAAKGGCNRNAFKIASRKPWYSTPMPRSPDGFLSGMVGEGPWIAFRKMARLSATNTLYVIQFRNSVSDTQKYGWALAMLTSPVRKQLRRVQRTYADGLRKLEPGAIAQLSLPQIPEETAFRRPYERAIKSLLKGDFQTARAIADRVVLGK